jgi:hypothetical protein
LNERSGHSDEANGPGIPTSKANNETFFHWWLMILVLVALPQPG